MREREKRSNLGEERHELDNDDGEREGGSFQKRKTRR